MKFGCCIDLDDFSKAASAKEFGFDFVELAIQDNSYLGIKRAIPDDITKPEIKQLRAKLDSLGLKLEVFNCFVPGNIKLVGEDVDTNGIKQYVEYIVEKVAWFTGKKIIFGSGGARKFPDGFSRKKAFDQLVNFLHICADIFKKKGIVLGIEPLPKFATNTINNLQEALELCRAVEREEIKIMVDYAHFNRENDSFENIEKAKDCIIHVHVADTDDLPPGKGKYDFGKLFSQLKKIGYNGGISIECRFKDFQVEAKQSLDFLRRTWQDS